MATPSATAGAKVAKKHEERRGDSLLRQALLQVVCRHSTACGACPSEGRADAVEPFIWIPFIGAMGYCLSFHNNQFDPSSGTAISSYGWREGYSATARWVVVVVLHLRAHLHYLLHVRCLWRHGVQEDRPANASLLTAFHTLFCLFGFFFWLFCASLPSAVCEKQALPCLNESAAQRK
jgi:hypothetical protein